MLWILKTKLEMIKINCDKKTENSNKHNYTMIKEWHKKINVNYTVLYCYNENSVDTEIETWDIAWIWR